MHQAKTFFRIKTKFVFSKNDDKLKIMVTKLKLIRGGSASLNREALWKVQSGTR
jgi:hypothetical protein